ncbi:MAG: hypothetical protein ABIH23_28250 [bacterium]
MKLTLFWLCIAVFAVGLVHADVGPKTLLFSPITPEYLEDSAAEWADAGFGGFLLSRIMHNWDSDVWAVDEDPKTRGEADANLQRFRKCCDALRAVGIEDNFIKVAFYSNLPDWFDNDGWRQLTENFRNAAEFARLAGLRGVAIDIEYISEIYDLDYEKYKENQYDIKALRAKALERGEQMIAPMFEVYPDMVLLTLPEGVTYYGPLATDLTVGFIRAAAKRDAPGGVHVLTEGTYQTTGQNALLSHIATVAGKMEDALSPDLRDYWKRRCSIVIGCWPLGYYRDLFDENGNQIGYGGKREKFGDEVIGSYADKSCNYPPSEFRTQYSFATSFARRYNWIYGHGATWWQFNEEEAKRYDASKNEQLPVDENLDVYKQIVKSKPPVTDPFLLDLAKQFLTTNQLEIAGHFGLIKDWLVLGPFENKEDPPERHTALRQKWIDTALTRFPMIMKTKDAKEMSWRLCHTDSRSGIVDGMPLFDPNNDISYFALCYVTSPDQRAAQLRVGSNDGAAVWVNGEKIYEVNCMRSVALDSDIIDIVLPAGTCPILIQVCQDGGITGFCARITNDNGQPLDDLTFAVGGKQ